MLILPRRIKNQRWLWLLYGMVAEVPKSHGIFLFSNYCAILGLGYLKSGNSLIWSWSGPRHFR
jgi:hypothetical protein